MLTMQSSSPAKTEESPKPKSRKRANTSCDGENPTPKKARQSVKTEQNVTGDEEFA